MPRYLTQEGLRRLKKELEELKTTKRQEIAERLQRSIAFGDLTENAEYQEAKEAQALLEGKILELEQLIESAVIIERDSRSTDIVSIGSSIVVQQTEPSLDAEEHFTIVGSEEADPARGFISNDSPLGSAFLSKKIGDVVEVQTPSGMKKFRILTVEK